jgi:hypothetical protein
MKNTIIIDVDTEREQQLQIRKPSDIQAPASAEEAKDVIVNDISCVFETFKMMVKIADKSGYASKNELIQTAIKDLETLLTPVEENNPK